MVFCDIYCGCKPLSFRIPSFIRPTQIRSHDNNLLGPDRGNMDIISRFALAETLRYILGVRENYEPEANRNMHLTRGSIYSVQLRDDVRMTQATDVIILSSNFMPYHCSTIIVFSFEDNNNSGSLQAVDWRRFHRRDKVDMIDQDEMQEIVNFVDQYISSL